MNNSYKYKLIRVPADLRDDLKKEASDTGRKLHEIAEAFFDELLDEQWEAVQRKHGAYSSADGR